MSVDCQQESTEQCSVPAPKNSNDTIGRLLSEINTILRMAQVEDPDSEATKTLKKDLEAADAAYDAIPLVIQEYKGKMDDFEKKLEEAERQQKQLEALTNDEYNPGDDIRDAIQTLFSESYEKEGKRLEKKYCEARADFDHTMDCLEQAYRRKSYTKDKFDEKKNYNNTVSNWFSDLTAIYDKAMGHMKAGNDRALYAYRLEFEKILEYARKIPLDEGKATGQASKKDNTLIALKNALSDVLRAWIIAIYEHYYWRKNWLSKEENEKRAKITYDEFETARREDFIREAMDVPGDGEQAC